MVAVLVEVMAAVDAAVVLAARDHSRRSSIPSCRQQVLAVPPLS
jgi:hypothetical protein